MHDQQWDHGDATVAVLHGTIVEGLNGYDLN